MLLCLWGRLPAAWRVCVGCDSVPCGVALGEVSPLDCDTVQGGSPVAQTPSSAVSAGHCSCHL